MMMDTMMDMDLQKDVMDELRWEPSVNAAHIGVTVKDGVVTLTGHVPSYSEKYAAEKAAKRVHGVKAVANELDVKLPGSSQRTDEDIALACVNALKANVLVPRDKIKVTVNRGWVTLEGEVEWQYQKGAAESAVRYLTGVVGVTQPDHGQAARVPERAEDQDRGRVQAQRRAGRQPHHRRGERRQGDPARQRALVGREGGGGPRGVGGPGGRQRREPHHRRAVVTTRRVA